MDETVEGHVGETKQMLRWLFVEGVNKTICRALCQWLSED